MIGHMFKMIVADSDAQLEDSLVPRLQGCLDSESCMKMLPCDDKHICSSDTIEIASE